MTRLSISTSLVGLCALFVAACSDLAHSNPFDSESAIDVRINAPQTVTALGGTITVSADVTPAQPGFAVRWSSKDTFALRSLGNGRFEVRIQPPSVSARDTATIIATVGVHSVEHRIQLRQLGFSASYESCIGYSTPRTDCTSISSFQDVRTMAFRIRDSLGSTVTLPFHSADLAQFTIRDQGVIRELSHSTARSFPELEYIAVNNGSTWVLVTTDRGRDSVQVTVRQQVQGLQFSFGCRFDDAIRMGVSRQIEILQATDGHGNPLMVPWTLTFEGGPDSDFPASEQGDVKMTNTGLLTPTRPGRAFFRAIRGDGSQAARCPFLVLP